MTKTRAQLEAENYRLTTKVEDHERTLSFMLGILVGAGVKYPSWLDEVISL